MGRKMSCVSPVCAAFSSPKTELWLGAEMWSWGRCHPCTQAEVGSREHHEWPGYICSFTISSALAVESEIGEIDW